jgi:tRNA-splicing ligase RtcB
MPWPSYFIELARQDMERWMIHLPDKDLAYFPEGTEHFDDYVEAVHLGAGICPSEP